MTIYRTQRNLTESIAAYNADDSLSIIPEAPNFFKGSLDALTDAPVDISAYLAKAMQDDGDWNDEPPYQRVSEPSSGLSEYLSALQSSRPDPATTGIAAQVIHSAVPRLATALGATMAGGPLFGATTLFGTEASVEYQRGIEQEKLDPGTAELKASVTGLLTGAGVILPAAVGLSIPTKIATGIIGNTALGMAERGTNGAILRGAGYSEMADQYQAFDKTSLLIDAVMGAGFGAISPSTDAALWLGLKRHVSDTAPGAPVDHESANLHQSVFDQAHEQMLRDQPINVDPAITEATFARAPAADYGFDEELNALRHEAGLRGLSDVIDQEDINIHREAAQAETKPQSTEPQVRRNGMLKLEPVEPSKALSQAGEIIDRRINELKDAISKKPSTEQLMQASENERIIREALRANDRSQTRLGNVADRMTPDEVKLATTELEKITQLREKNGGALDAEKALKTLNEKLSRATDKQLLKLAGVDDGSRLYTGEHPAEAIAKANEAVAIAEHESKAFEAAVRCYLGETP